MEVYLERSTPVTIRVDGRTVRTRTHHDDAGDVLADLGIVLAGQDYVNVIRGTEGSAGGAGIDMAGAAGAATTPETTLGTDATIEVVRVSERFLIEQEPIPFESVWRPDPDLEIDQRRLLQEGSPGVRERRSRVQYENGHEISRTVENEYVAVSPTTNVTGYGTRIIVRTVSTPSGTREYWRTIRMLATSYSASTAGVSKSSPHYGYTATGLKMRDGIVAVDPRLIDLGSRVYVPGYGLGLAADTGGAIKGKRIDLGYDDDTLQLWYRWVEVYVLTPVPPSGQINYTLP
jgi:3D (Asp-Asp-Asp) domain-containing protein